MSIYNIYLFIRLPWKFVCLSPSVKVLTFTSMSRKSKVVSILNLYTYSHWWAPFKWGSFWWPWYLTLAVRQSGNYWTDKVKVISPLTMDVRMSKIAKPLLISLMTGYGKKQNITDYETSIHSAYVRTVERVKFSSPEWCHKQTNGPKQQSIVIHRFSCMCRVELTTGVT